MTDFRPLRSALYVPGNNQRALEKARSLPADMIIFDLEDAVNETDSEMARTQVCSVLSRGEFGEGLIAVRINHPLGKTGQADLQKVLEAGVDAIVCPKVQTVDDITSLSSRIDQVLQGSGSSDVQVWAMMETARGILNAREIAALAGSKVPRLGGFIIGTNDLVRETRAARSHITPWLMDCVLAAKAYGLTILDGVYNRFDDEDGLLKECHEARAMGMDGKTVIHPDQIQICNDSFSPTQKEVQEAREIIALFEQPENLHANVVQLRGRMVERLHYEQSREAIIIARSIANRKGD